MSTFRLTQVAKQDLVEIRTYIAKDKPNTAIRYMSILKEKCQMLADNPGLGVQRQAYFGLYTFPVGDYLIFYRPSADGINVIRVLHGSRDVENIPRK